MKSNINISKRAFRPVKSDGRFKVICRPLSKRGRFQPGHRVKRM